MEKFDVVIIGGGLGSLTTATYLSKRLRNIAVFETGKKQKIAQYTTRFKDSENSVFSFKFYNHDMGGVHEGDLFREYLKQCGLQDQFKYYDNDYSMIINENRQLIKRPNNLDDFRTYLVRHYPKYRNKIHKFFEDIKVSYDDFKEQKQARLFNQEYTLTAAMIEFIDLSLFDVLNKYSFSKQLINEFTLVYGVLAFDAKEINAYNYFVKWFDTFIDGSHFIASSYDDIVKTLSNEISKTKEKIFLNRQIEKFVIKENKIEKLIDSEGNEIVARHYVINMRIDDFVEQYMPERLDIKEEFYQKYPSIQEEKYTNRVFIGLDCSSEEINMNEKQYLFSNIEEDQVRLLSVMNYKKFDPKSCKDGKTAIMVEFVDDNSTRSTKLNQVVAQFIKYFPKAEGHITLQRIGVKQDLISSVANKDYWKGKEINDLFSIDDYSELNPFVNSYFIGGWLRPESGITGIIQTGVEYGDIIDDLIYHGEDDDYFINHDELMNIINHQFISHSLGKEEKNIQFFIGKDSYYIRTKGAHQRLFKGVTDMSDLIIIATNECLYDLSVGNTTLEKALKKGTIEYVGSREFLNSVMEAFDMGIEITKPIEYKYIKGSWGTKIFLLQMSILMLMNLLMNYHNTIIVAPITLVFFGGSVYFKYRLTEKISIFEYFVLGLYFVMTILSIFIPVVNELKDSKIPVGIFTAYLLITWLAKIPIAFGYMRHDYRADYTRTKLFKNVCGGLTFIWGVTFLLLLITDIAMIRSYASLVYYMLPLSLYLSFYYPSSYIRGYIS